MTATPARFTTWSHESAVILLAETSTDPGPVLVSLQAVQDRFGYVPAEAVSLIADACNVSRADVHGVLTFYTDLRTSPPPDVPVRLCAAEACQSVGGRELKRDWERRCGESAELAEATGADEPVFCLGNCALAPAALVGGVLVGRATVEKVESMVRRSLQESP